MAETKQETYAQAEEPAQSPVERVTEKVKDPKKVAVGRAGAAARKAKQERLLEQLRGAKESFRPPAGDGMPANIPIFLQRKRIRNKRFPCRNAVKD